MTLVDIIKFWNNVWSLYYDFKINKMLTVRGNLSLKYNFIVPISSNKFYYNKQFMPILILRKIINYQLNSLIYL